jgi:hypothetical protein
MEGAIEVTGRKGRRHKQLLDDLQETTGDLKLKAETPSSQSVEHSLWTCRETDSGMSVQNGSSNKM